MTGFFGLPVFMINFYIFVCCPANFSQNFNYYFVSVLLKKKLKSP